VFVFAIAAAVLLALASKKRVVKRKTTVIPVTPVA